MKLGSLFDGSGGFPLSGAMTGFTPVWASEIEPYPIAVTRSRFPQMRHLGNVFSVNGAEIESVDVVTFGSPCQDMSLAGTRSGLKHRDLGDEETTRSGAFMEAVRIIKEMRKATDGRYPAFAVWENVPGAFSSSGGADFLAVLEELAKIVDPEVSIPESEKWCTAGQIVGDGWSIAWRTIDAQFWGRTVRDRDTGAVRYRGTPQRRRRIYLVMHLAGERAGEVLFEREGLRGYSAPCRTPWERIAGDAEGSTSVQDAECYDARGNGDGATVNTLVGDHENRVTDYSTVVCLQANGIDRADTAGCNGKGVKEDVSYTLNTVDRHGVCYAIGNGQANQSDLHDIPGALNCMHDQQAVLVCSEQRYIVRRLTPTECARLQGFPDTWGHPDVKTKLTDEEYAFWTEVRCTYAAVNGKEPKTYSKDQMLKWYNGLHTDSSEYKMWGNGIALPCAVFVLQGIAYILQEET